MEQPLKPFVLSDKDERQMFKRNPTRNPVTGERLKRDEAGYRRLAEKYGDAPVVSRAIRPDKKRLIAELFRKSALFDFTLTLRRLRAELINETIREFELDKWNHCLFPNADFQKKFDETRIIGRGTFGKVYLLKYRTITFTVKEAVVTRDFQENLAYSLPGTQKWDEWTEDSYPEEFDVQLTVNEALDQRLSPHFIYTIGGGLCKDCRELPEQIPEQGYENRCYIVAMEAADSNLEHYRGKPLSPDVIANFMQQLLLGTTILHGRFGINHRDIKAQNILVKRVPPGGHFRYEYPERTFYVANMGYILMLSDYGVSWMMQRSYNKRSRFYGMRNAVFRRNGRSVGWGKNAGEEYTLQPYNTKYIPDFNAGSTIVRELELNDDFNDWYRGDEVGSIGEYTVNWMCDVDLEPDIPLSVIDTRTMPAWQFAGDIQDVLRTLVGGKRWFLPGDHVRFNFDIKEAGWLRRVLRMTAVIPHGPELFNISGKHTGPYLLADVMMARLFPENGIPLKTSTLDIYRWNGAS